MTDGGSGSQRAQRRGRSRCQWCGVVFAVNAGPGRPAKYCRRSHRQRAYEARRLAEAHGLGPDDVLLTRDTFDLVRDRLYILESAVQDATADRTTVDAGAVLDELLRTARLVAATEFEPKAVG